MILESTRNFILCYSKNFANFASSLQILQKL